MLGLRRDGLISHLDASANESRRIVCDDETTREPFVAAMPASRCDNRNAPRHGSGELGAAAPGVTENRMQKRVPRRRLPVEFIVLEAPKIVDARILAGQPLPQRR